jgi:2-amino-4-hydroxy-6-hydroxymethyldihydropteridine diphosphokinase
MGVLRVPEESEAWIGFGGNLGDRLGNLREALAAFGLAVEAVSPIYETAPWGVLDQPWFLNGVARLRWTAGPIALLERCLAIEQELGRVRQQRNGPRRIDLDVLVLGPRPFGVPGLTIPHPGIGRRRSVLEPWADLSPELLVPGLDGSLESLRAASRGLSGQEVRLFRSSEDLVDRPDPFAESAARSEQRGGR